MKYRAWKGPWASPWLAFTIGYRQIKNLFIPLILLAETNQKVLTQNNLRLLTDGLALSRTRITLLLGNLMLFTENDLELFAEDDSILITDGP